MKKLVAFIFALSLCAGSSPAFAASGCTYPTSLDSYVDKLAGDFLTISDVNTRSCSIEKLEAGPLRPNSGSVSAPAFAFLTSSGSGMYLAATNTVAITAGSVRVAEFGTIASGVNYITVAPAATGVGPVIRSNGSDTNVTLTLDTKGTGSLILATAGSARMRIDQNGRMLMNHSITTGSDPGDIILSTQTGYRFLNAAANSSSGYGLSSDGSDNLIYSVPASTKSHNFAIGGTNRFRMQQINSGPVLGFLNESTADPGSPGANAAYLYTKDNGGGKTQLCAQFNTGAVQCFATEP